MSGDVFDEETSFYHQPSSDFIDFTEYNVVDASIRANSLASTSDAGLPHSAAPETNTVLKYQCAETQVNLYVVWNLDIVLTSVANFYMCMQLLHVEHLQNKVKF